MRRLLRLALLVLLRGWAANSLQSHHRAGLGWRWTGLDPPRVTLFWMAIAVRILPLVVVPLLVIMNGRDLLGEYRNGLVGANSYRKSFDISHSAGKNTRHFSQQSSRWRPA